ncbi:MAG: lipopolysaccharide heptosyltransferase II [Desulfobacterales bacterium]
MKKIHPRAVRKILIRAANWVGDAVMSTPMIRAVRGNFPHAHISILAKPWVAPVFEHSPHIDQILVYEAAGRHKGISGILRLAKELRTYDFDMALLVQNAFEAALISFLAGIPIRAGYNTDGRTFLLTHAVPMSKEIKKRHQIDYYLGIPEGLGLHTFGREMRVEISVPDRKRSAEILRNLGISEEKGMIGINPGAAYGSAKRWPKDRYAQLCGQLRRSCSDMPVIVFGGPDEAQLGQEICQLAGEGCFSLAGQTNLREAISLIERCRLFVTNDSGLMHAAAALHIPQIAIFGPTDHSTTSPADSASRMIRVPTPCSPCMKQECPLKHHQCMKAVSADTVLREAEQILK